MLWTARCFCIFWVDGFWSNKALLRLCIESQHALAGSLPLSSFVRVITIVEHGTENWLTKFSRNSKNSNVYCASVQKSQVIQQLFQLVVQSLHLPTRSYTRQTDVLGEECPATRHLRVGGLGAIEVEITNGGNGGYPGSG